ncbi:MAG: hypothetical protein Greene041619_955 [Candidatus Peregrinibacteria bacterium Greene0416_19]|nr:MAG: hypothetical protein Greene041619_955 [Candidatus Peregrinibacteria bacterium Greene0416_19]
MKKVVQSFGYAWEGFVHAIIRERNFRTFFVAYFLVLLPIALVWLPLKGTETALLFLAGGMFLAVELLNTALERLTDAVDECHCAIHNASSKRHAGLKATKDIAAAASLVCLVTAFCIAVAVVGPHLVTRIVG